MSAPDPDMLLNVFVDHPFLFFVRDKKHGAILFAGKMASPEFTGFDVER